MILCLNIIKKIFEYLSVILWKTTDIMVVLLVWYLLCKLSMCSTLIFNVDTWVGMYLNTCSDFAFKMFILRLKFTLYGNFLTIISFIYYSFANPKLLVFNNKLFCFNKIKFQLIAYSSNHIQTYINMHNQKRLQLIYF